MKTTIERGPACLLKERYGLFTFYTKACKEDIFFRTEEGRLFNRKGEEVDKDLCKTIGLSNSSAITPLWVRIE
jgi:hypothetical protein